MPDPTSLPDLLAKALLDMRWRLATAFVPKAQLEERERAAKALVPAVMAALTVEPDDHDRYGNPHWSDGWLVNGPITVNEFGVTWGDQADFVSSEIPPTELEHAARVLLSVAAEMRRHDAWKENEGE